MYGRTALISGVITKARDRVKAHYCLTGTLNQVRDRVEWLLKDSVFVYGGIEAGVRLSLIF